MLLSMMKRQVPSWLRELTAALRQADSRRVDP
jgi:hypothetical protein